MPKAPSIAKLVKGKGSMTVKAKKQKKKFTGRSVSSYEMEYSLNKYFSPRKGIKSFGYKKGYIKLKKLKHGKRYYVRIRTVTYVGGEFFYSPWSEVKSVVVK